jgi:signal peptidase II|tara:strand:+ start:25 stop:576 length:552 start_codon:yes stop_codon:yes gene_type:complete
MLMAPAKLESMRKWIFLVVVLTVIDQITKRFAEAALEFAMPITAMPMFNWMLVYNEGAAFSFLSEAGGWQRWFFVALASAVCIYIFNWLRKLETSEILLGTSLSFILSGALGNLIDRALYGKVTDFIDFYYKADECIYFFYHSRHGSCHWPTFNIADILITLGASLLIIHIFKEPSSNDAHKN